MQEKTLREQMGNRIRDLRERKGLTQDDMARALHLADYRTYAPVERGRRGLKDEEIVVIADRLGTTAEYLLRGVDPSNVDICNATGLNNDAVNFLKRLTQSKQDEPVPLAWYPGISKEIEEAFQSPDMIGMGEACYPSSILDVLNLLLSGPKGRLLLSAIASFVALDASDPWTETYLPESENPVSVPVDVVNFKSALGQHGIGVSAHELAFFALKGAVDRALFDVRESLKPNEIRKEMEAFERKTKEKENRRK